MGQIFLRSYRFIGILSGYWYVTQGIVQGNGLHIVMKLGIEHANNFAADRLIIDRKADFDAPVNIPVHPVGRAKVYLRIASVME